jgi:hypothetical protein
MLGHKHKTDRQKRTEEYQKLGRQIESMYDAVNPDRTSLYRTAFLKGVAQGVGGIIGATVVVALLVWLLSLFQEIPGLGHVIDSVRHTLQRH